MNKNKISKFTTKKAELKNSALNWIRILKMRMTPDIMEKLLITTLYNITKVWYIVIFIDYNISSRNGG